MYAAGAFISFILFWVFCYQYQMGALNPLIYATTSLHAWYVVITFALGILTITFIFIHFRR